jgi:acetolactate synthase-1/2/3 large subunit
MNGAQWVVHALRAQQVDTVFGYPGGAIMPVYDALYDGGVEHLCAGMSRGRQWRLSVMRARPVKPVCVSPRPVRAQPT